MRAQIKESAFNNGTRMCATATLPLLLDQLVMTVKTNDDKSFLFFNCTFRTNKKKDDIRINLI